MYEPELFNNGHKEFKAIAGQFLKSHFAKVQWRPEGCQTFMDVGSGPGDTFNDYIYPLVRDKFHKFICSDVSEEMLAFAEKTYGIANKFDYRLFDITTPVGVPKDLRGAIDHVTAIYVLHLVQDFGQSLKNLYDFLRPNGGECFIMLMPRNSTFEAYHYLSNSPKWRDYKEIIERYIPPLFHSPNPKAEFEKLLMKTGFSEISTETETGMCTYDSLENLRGSLQSTCVVLKYLPTPDLRSAFLDELVNKVISLIQKSETDTKYYIKYDILAVRAKRN